MFELLLTKDLLALSFFSNTLPHYAIKTFIRICCFTKLFLISVLAKFASFKFQLSIVDISECLLLSQHFFFLPTYSANDCKHVIDNIHLIVFL